MRSTSTGRASCSTFPILQQLDSEGGPVAVPVGVLPSMHSFRHTVASRALLAGESIDEVAFLLGHRDATVTRTVYVREVADGRRRALRRSRMVEEYGGLLRASLAAYETSPDSHAGDASSEPSQR